MYILAWSKIHKSPGLTLSDNGKTVKVTGEDGDHTILIGDKKITRGAVQVSVRVIIPRPNRYCIGVLPQIPETFNRGFGYKNGLIGWGLHDHAGSKGIFCQNQQVAESTLGYSSGDVV